MAILDYPSTYPKPQRASFSAQTNQGVRRVAFESGYSRQRTILHLAADRG